MVRRAIGGDPAAIAWITTTAASTHDATVLVVAALVAEAPRRLDRARSIASTSRDRQLVAIAHAHIAGDHDLVDALARDHLVDHPGSIVVAWIASGAVSRRPPESTP